MPPQVSNKQTMQWTAEQVSDLVPPKRRESYETEYEHKINKFYERVAELKNLLRETQWVQTLELRFEKYFCAFYFGNKRLFGVNLQGTPKLCVWITEAEADRLSKDCEANELRPIFKHANENRL